MALTTVSSDRLSTNVKNTNFTAAEKQDLTDDILPLAGELGNRNLIINGAMQVAQRGTSETGVNSSGYKNVCDRWRFNASGSNVGAYTVSQSTTSPDGFGSSLKIDCTTARTPASNELYEVEQRFEGQNLQAFAKGTSAAKKFSVSFYVKTNVSGNYVVWLYDADNNRNIGAVYTVSDSNWNRYTVSFPADTTGAFGNDNARSLDLRFVLLAGTDFTSGTLPTAAWEGTSNANSRAGQTANVASSTSNEWYLTGVQLEVGSVVTDFEHRSFGKELGLCQRYYYRTTCDATGQRYALGMQMTGSTASMQINFPTTLRTKPTALETSGTASDYSVSRTSTHEVCNTVPTFAIATPYLAVVNTSQTDASLSTGQAVQLRANGTGFFLGFSAEL
jgi:hypothetical protein